MSRYPRLENGVRVNMMRQKFERSISPKAERPCRDADELKDSLRRSLSASPVKSKKNLKLDVSRRLSNPGKNIKRTPAFRGDKLSRTRNLQSPTKERLVSIVDRNVKIFEPEYGKIGSLEKKWRDSEEPTSIRDGRDFEMLGWNDCSARGSMRETCVNRVRTRVISRQTNISPIYKRSGGGGDDDDERSIVPASADGQVDSTSREIFLKNGAEYTRVMKRSEPCRDGSKSDKHILKSRVDDEYDILDVREELSRRIGSDDVVDGDLVCPAVGLTDRLKVALLAPLPPGPPPKKPPRTFAHSRYDGKIVENIVSQSDEDRSSPLGAPSSTATDPRIIGEKKLTREKICISGGKVNSGKEPRDSKKMLEKLEHVLIEHKKAGSGPMPRSRENNENKNVTGSLRTLESRDSKNRKHSSTFDCLPSLNCANSNSVYERVGDADFKSYHFTKGSSLSGDSKITVSRSADPIKNSNVIGNSKFYDETAAKRLSAELTTFSDCKVRRDVHEIEKERVYAEPFAFDKNSGTDITGYGVQGPEEHNYFSRSPEDERFAGSKLSNSRQNSSLVRGRGDETLKPELHYMCTSIEPLEDNNNVIENNSGRSKDQRTIGITKNLSLDQPVGTAEKYEKNKVEQLLNRAFGKFAMSDSSSDTDSTSSDRLESSFSDKLRLFKNRENTSRPNRDELHRSLTEKRKNYVRRVSSKYTEGRRESLVDRRDGLFQVCLLIELNLSTREPYIKDKYPVYAKTPAWIENFCFPDAKDWPPSSRSSQNQFYSLALMDERGNRSYGYCCRVRPEDGPILPLAYCLITKHRASGFYNKVLLQLESRHGLPEKQRRTFIEELYDSPMPKRGQSLRMTDDMESSRSSTSNNNFVSSKCCDSSVSGDETNEIESRTNRSMENVITRSGDPRLEERDMSQLFDALSNKVLVILFGSLLLERKVVLLCDKLSKLSSCVEALESLLYPFTWPHTFVPVLPDIPGLSEILEAPLPFVIGIFKSKNFAYTRVASVQDGIVVDLDTSKIVCAVGDESSILPSRLQKKIRSDLQLVSNDTKCGDGIRNFLVSEAFLRTFVETCSHYDSHVVTQQDGKVIFQKESFVKASSSKTEQYFLEWFVETTMFNTFVQNRIERMEGSGERDELFHRRIAEYRKGSEKSAQTKKSSSKKKTLGKLAKMMMSNFRYQITTPSIATASDGWRPCCLAAAIFNCIKKEIKLTLHNLKKYRSNETTACRTMFCPMDLTRSTLLHGPPELTKSFVFEAAIHLAEEGHRVVYITPAPLESLPATYHDRNKLSPEAFKLMRFMYLENYESLVDQLVDLHNFQALPSALLIDDIDAYIQDSDGQQRPEVDAARLFAFIRDSTNACSRILKRPVRLCVSASSTLIPYSMYFGDVWGASEGGHVGSIRLFQVRENFHRVATKVFDYKKFTDGTLVLLEISFLSRDPGTSRSDALENSIHRDSRR